MTCAGVERIFRFAFALARSRPRKLLTIVTNERQRHAMVKWDESARSRARVPDVARSQDAGRCDDHAHDDQACDLDTIVASNLDADILSDLAAALAARSASRRPRTSCRRRFPSMSSRSTVGVRHRRHGDANPIGSFWTGDDARTPRREGCADRLMRAIERVTATPPWHAGPRRRRTTRGDRRGDRGDPRRKPLTREVSPGGVRKCCSIARAKVRPEGRPEYCLNQRAMSCSGGDRLHLPDAASRRSRAASPPGHGPPAPVAAAQSWTVGNQSRSASRSCWNEVKAVRVS